MKASLIFVLATLALLSISASYAGSSETALKACLSSAYKTASTSSLPSKDVLKLVATATKECKALTKDSLKTERLAKKREKLQAQIAKLQAKLSSN